MNAWTGTVVANAAIVPAAPGGLISVYVSNNSDVLFDINGYFAPPGSGGFNFYPATPCRIADTRVAGGMSGDVGPPTMAGLTTRTFPVPFSNCGIPASSAAYSLNVTVVPPAPLGFLSIWPTGVTQPGVSTLNSPNGAALANAAIVPAGTSGFINIFVFNTSDVLFDINGYFAP